ncbi:hypothetical protein COCOBI_01-7050 [Coccomyxa sp. Obi]|nr:hypothetical protein COCOBI_01-7050 [Coccomyxa sp. Obi]
MHSLNAHGGFRPFVSGFRPVKLQPSRQVARSENGTSQSKGIDEDVLQRLRIAEEEAAKLRQELAKAKAEAVAKGDSGAVDQIEEAIRSNRIDSGDLKRLDPFSGSDKGNWLREADVSFLIGNGPGEAENAALVSESEGETVKRRLLIGGVLTVALGALALVPTDSLRIMKPTKPLFMYLIPLIRIQALLTDVREIVAEAQWDELGGALQRIQGTPNNAVSNLRDAAYSIEDSRKRERAEVLARDIIECLDSIDYKKYFDAMGRPGSRGGMQEKQFSDFSIRAVDASQAKLKEFLELMPRDAVAAAKEQATVPL